MRSEDIIKGHCVTNLDNYDVSKVKGFVRIPAIGENVSVSYSGRMDSYLKVVQITHDYRNNEPYIIVELHRYTSQDTGPR